MIVLHLFDISIRVYGLKRRKSPEESNPQFTLNFVVKEFAMKLHGSSAVSLNHLGTVRPLCRTGVSLLPRERFYIFNQQVYFII